MSNLPTGTVTFLFTDIEGSTKLAQEHPDQWESLRERHHAILWSAIESHNGYVFQIIGDAFCAAFHTAKDGLEAAIESQRKLQSEDWGDTPIKVRMGLHTGEAKVYGSEYRGYLTMAKVQRVMSVAYGRQILLSNASAELIHNELPEGIILRDMKEHRLKGLLNPEHLWQIIAPDLQRDFPPLQSLKEIPNNLPVQLTTFIGREKEVGQIKKRLEKNRLVTLTGSGGVGKTRLSIQVASELLDTYPNGAWLVELAPLTDPALVSQAVCTTLDVTPQGNTSPLTVLTDYLHAKKLLLVVDNCEHLIDACAQLGESLLHACPDLRIIASSREALGIDGENDYRVPSLALPDSHGRLSTIQESEAVKLFVERATAILPEFELTESNAPVVAQICQRLDGIALAIELAASRVKILNVEQIAARLDDAFRLLTGGSRTALPRQQTLRALIDWSYNLLSEEERTVLRRLSVFMGGWTLEAAEAVCDNPNMLDVLTHLVDKSLVSIDREHGDEPRYYLLETVRQYARAKLFESGEGKVMRDRHMEALLNLAERAEPEIRGANQKDWLDRLEEEIDNLRAALEWSRERDKESCMRLAGALWRFWDLRGYNADAFEWFAQSITLGNGLRTIARTRLLSRASAFYRNAAEEKKSLQLAQEASALARELNDKESLALALGIEGEARLNQPEIAQPLLEEALRINEELGDHWSACTKWYALAELANRQNDHELQRSCIEKGLEEARLSGDHRRISVGLGYLSFYYLDRGKFSRAEEIIREGLALATQIGDKDNVAERSLNLANALIYLEKYSEAESFLVESRKAYEEIGNNSYLVGAICGLSYLAWVRGDISQFTELSSEALKIARQVDSLYALAPALIHHGSAALVNHGHQLAREELSETIRVCQRMKMNWYYGWGIAVFGMLALAEGQLERAAQIFGAYEQLAPSLPADTPFLVRKIHEQMEFVKNELGNELFEASAAKGRGMPLEQALTFILGETND